MCFRLQYAPLSALTHNATFSPVAAFPKAAVRSAAFAPNSHVAAAEDAIAR